MTKVDEYKRQLVIIIIAGVVTTGLGLFTVNSLVSNSREAKRRYDALIAVDQSGGDVEQALTDLRSYIYAHMNTRIGSPTGTYPPIQLKGTYDRLMQAEQAKLEAVNETLYNQAQAECEKQFPGGLSGRGRIPCITDYVTSKGVKLTEIPTGLYQFDFVSPTWSPDAAGIGLVLTAISGLVLLISSVYLWHFRNIVKRSF